MWYLRKATITWLEQIGLIRRTTEDYFGKFNEKEGVEKWI